MAQTRSILKEAVAEAKSLKEAALKNAENSLAGHFRESLEQLVEEELNLEAAGDECDDEGDDETMEETLEHDPYGDTISEMYDDDDDLELEPDSDEDDLGFGDEDELEESAGFSEAELFETIQQAMVEMGLNEVDHGDLGEMEDVDPDTHSTGLMDDDKKEAGWEEKSAPAKKDWTVKETKYRQKLAKVVAENAALKKANKKLKEAVAETNLFNRKLHYAHKLLQTEGLSRDVKMKLVKKLDGANTVSELNHIYESLEVALGVISESAKGKASRKQSLSETLGSHVKNERGLSQVKKDHLLNEDVSYSAARFQKLAGIGKYSK